MSSQQDERTGLEADRRWQLARLPRQRRPGRVGASCARCQVDLDAPDNHLGRDLVSQFDAQHAGHERRATAPAGQPLLAARAS